MIRVGVHEILYNVCNLINSGFLRNETPRTKRASLARTSGPVTTAGLYFSYTGDSNSLQPFHSLHLMGHPPQSFASLAVSGISSLRY